MRRFLALIPFVAACDPFGHFPNGEVYLDGSLWDSQVQPSKDGGVYVQLPTAHQLIHVNPDNKVDEIDLDGFDVRQLMSTPDNELLLAFSEQISCSADRNKPIELVEDCPQEDRDHTYALKIVDGTQVSATADVPGHMNTVEFSPDYSTAVAFLDSDNAGDLSQYDGIIDPSEVMFIDVASGDTQSMSVGLYPKDVLYSQQNDRAVVLSRSQAKLIDLADLSELITFNLSLDPDDAVDPIGAELTPDGRYAVISVEGSQDLYTLDLEVVHIDIKELVAAPSAMWVSDDAKEDVTVLAYNTQSQLDVFDHTYFNSVSVDLEEPCNQIVGGEGYVVAYNDRATTHDVYRLDLSTLEATEYVMANPVNSLEVIEAGKDAYAVAVLRPEGSSGSGLEELQDRSWGLGIMNLTTDASQSLILPSEPVGVALTEQDGRAYALVLMAGLDTLLMVDLAAPNSPLEVELEAAPISIGGLPDGNFYITHQSPLGLISFLNPTDVENPQIAHGFGTIGMFDEYELATSDEE